MATITLDVPTTMSPPTPSKTVNSHHTKSKHWWVRYCHHVSAHRSMPPRRPTVQNIIKKQQLVKLMEQYDADVEADDDDCPFNDDCDSVSLTYSSAGYRVGDSDSVSVSCCSSTASSPAGLTDGCWVDSLGGSVDMADTIDFLPTLLTWLPCSL